MWKLPEHKIETKARDAYGVAKRYFENMEERGCNYVYLMMREMYDIYIQERQNKHAFLNRSMKQNETRESREWIPMWSNDPWDDNAMLFLKKVTESFNTYVGTIGASDDMFIDIAEDDKVHIAHIIGSMLEVMGSDPSTRVTGSMYIAAAEVLRCQRVYTEASRQFVRSLGDFQFKPRRGVDRLPELHAPSKFDIFTNYLAFPKSLHLKERIRTFKLVPEFSHVRKVLLYIDLSKYNRTADGRDTVEPADAWTLLREIMNSVALGQSLRREILGWNNCGAEVHIRIRPAPLLEICWNTKYGNPIDSDGPLVHVFYRTALFNVINFRVSRAYIVVKDEEITTEFLSQFQRRYVFDNETKSWCTSDDDKQPTVLDTFTMCTKEFPSAFSERLPADFAVYADQVMKFLREEEVRAPSRPVHSSV